MAMGVGPALSVICQVGQVLHWLEYRSRLIVIYISWHQHSIIQISGPYLPSVYETATLQMCLSYPFMTSSFLYSYYPPISKGINRLTII